MEMRDHYFMFLDGGWRDSREGRTFDVENPATGGRIASVTEALPEDVDDAVQAGSRAFASGRWAGMRGRDRARVLQRAADLLADRLDDLARLETLQIGRPYREMRSQLRRTPEWLEYFGAIAQTIEGSLPDFGGEHLNYVVREPLGVAGLVTPWNHPLLITMKKLSAALAAGNSVVIKPSELAPVTPLLLAELLQEAGLPEGVLNVVPGFGSVTGKALTEHPGLGRIDVTGGTETGRLVAAAAGRNLTPVTAELGGKAPVLIFNDVEPKRGAAGAAFSAFVAAGQTCIQGARVLIHQDILDPVMESLVGRAASLRVGDPFDAATQLGPLASAAALERVSGMVDRARDEGGRILCGGRRAQGPGVDEGYFYEATVITDVTPDMEIWREEVFGPVTVIVPFRTEDEAVALANDTPYGLAAAIWTESVSRAHRVARRLDVGVIWINDHHRIDPASPWGGTKASGLDRENGFEAYRSYTQTKSVIVNTSDEFFDWYATDEELRYS
ncbi:MAG: aldehyde dehydrogenase family protein [Nitriliruptorales bacterium]|nr:aldehyde dehydrogenase family protein [Nitriliruptorales bacterium]